MWIYKANYIRSLCRVKSSGLDSDTQSDGQDRDRENYAVGFRSDI